MLKTENSIDCSWADQLHLNYPFSQCQIPNTKKLPYPGHTSSTQLYHLGQEQFQSTMEISVQNSSNKKNIRLVQFTIVLKTTD